MEEILKKEAGKVTIIIMQVPNIPLLTGFHKIRGTFGGFISTGDIALKLITKSGRGERIIILEMMTDTNLSKQIWKKAY